MNAFKSLDIQKEWKLWAWTENTLGPHLEAADRIILSKDDPNAGGGHHLISIDWVAYVDQKVHPKKSSAKATSENKHRL